MDCVKGKIQAFIYGRTCEGSWRRPPPSPQRPFVPSERSWTPTWRVWARPAIWGLKMFWKKPRWARPSPSWNQYYVTCSSSARTITRICRYLSPFARGRRAPALLKLPADWLQFSLRDLELPAMPEQQNKLQPGVRDSPVPGLHLRKHHRRPRPAGPLH